MNSHEPVDGVASCAAEDGPVSSKRERRWLIAICGYLILVAWLPGLATLTAIVGFLAWKFAGRHSVRAAVAMTLGLFFTAIYGVVIWGYVALLPPKTESLYFIAEADPSLRAPAQQVQNQQYGDAIVAANRIKKAPESRGWAYHALCAVAMSKAAGTDAEIAGAFDEFKKAREMGGETSAELAYFEGMLCLRVGEVSQAAACFEQAVALKADLSAAHRGLELVANTFSPTRTIQVIMMVLCLLVMFTTHECAHALAAYRLGDPTAAQLGRLTLNPIPHMELFGSLVFPAVLIMNNAPFLFGWAKPVPVNPANFKNPRRDDTLVSLAGPAANLLVVMIASLAILTWAVVTRKLFPGLQTVGVCDLSGPIAIAGMPSAHVWAGVVYFLKQLILMGVVFGVFNLIPVPPLDGSWVLQHILPVRWGAVIERLRPYGWVILVLLMVTDVTTTIINVPLGAVWLTIVLGLTSMGVS